MNTFYRIVTKAPKSLQSRHSPIFLDCIVDTVKCPGLLRALLDDVGGVHDPEGLNKNIEVISAESFTCSYLRLALLPLDEVPDPDHHLDVLLATLRHLVTGRDFARCDSLN